MSIYDDLTGLVEGLKTRLGELSVQGVTTVVGYTSKGIEWPLTATGVIKPCAVVGMPALSAGGRRTRPITGAKDGLLNTRFNVMCVGPTSNSCIKVMGLVLDSLVGHRPTPGAGEINLLGSAILEPAMQVTSPTRYAMPIGFTLAINTIVVS